MPRRGTESEFELTTIDRLELLGYEHLHGSDLAPERSSEEEVVLRGRLRGEERRPRGDRRYRWGRCEVGEAVGWRA